LVELLESCSWNLSVDNKLTELWSSWRWM